MDLFRKKKEQPSEQSPLSTSHLDVKSTETTPYQSGVPSEFEKEGLTEPSVHSAQPSQEARPASQPQDGETAIESAEKKIEGIEKEADEEDDDIEYPKAMKLTLITIALCLSVFCMGMLEKTPSQTQHPTNSIWDSKGSDI